MTARHLELTLLVCGAQLIVMSATDDPAPRFSRKRFQWALLLFNAKRAERRGEFSRGIELLDEANGIKPLKSDDRAYRALLLLRAQRLQEAQSSLARLRVEWQDSSDPNLQYLRRWATATLGLIQTNPLQFDREARAARSIPCKRGLRWRFPLIIPED